MEDFYNTKRLALILAKQAEIEGMKTDNLMREQQGNPPAFQIEDFQCMAGDLENLAYMANEQL